MAFYIIDIHNILQYSMIKTDTINQEYKAKV